MFKKKNYSDLEFQEIMETLFLEKKKVKELQLKLSNCSLSPVITPNVHEISILKAEINNLQVKQEESKRCALLNETKRSTLEIELQKLKQQPTNDDELDRLKQQIKKLQLELDAASQREFKTKSDLQKLQTQEAPQDKQKEAQLERVVQFMRARLEETQLENNQWMQKFLELEDLKNKLQEELHQDKNIHQKLTESLQIQSQEKQDLQEEISALKSQMEQLRKEVLKQQECLGNHADEEKRYHETLMGSQEEIEHLKHLMQSSLAKANEERLHEETSYQSQIASLLKEFEKDRISTAALKEERDALLAQLGNLQNHLAPLEMSEIALKEELEQVKQASSALKAERDEHFIQLGILQDLLTPLEISEKALKEEVEGLKRAQQELAQFAEEIKAKLIQNEEEKNNLIDSLSKKEELTHNLGAQVANLSRSCEKMEDAVRQKELEKQEYEIELRTAGQHLAKKMRESALTEEQNKELKSQAEIQGRALEEAKNKLVELKTQMEEKEIQKQNLLKQYQEGQKSLESQKSKFEEKCHQLQEKWQDAEMRIRELKKLEERFGKLQLAFTHIGSMISAPITLEPLPPPTFDIPPPAKTFTEQELTPKELSHSAPSLFDSGTKSSRYKETLFG